MNEELYFCIFCGKNFSKENKEEIQDHERRCVTDSDQILRYEQELDSQTKQDEPKPSEIIVMRAREAR